MRSVLLAIILALRDQVHAALHVELIALRHQLSVLNRNRPPRVRVQPANRLLWVWLSRCWSTMSEANPRWGGPRIHGELLKLSIELCQATVAQYMVRRRQPPSQTWRPFLKNQVGQIVASDFFVVPTETYRAA